MCFQEWNLWILSNPLFVLLSLTIWLRDTVLYVQIYNELLYHSLYLSFGIRKWLKQYLLCEGMDWNYLACIVPWKSDIILVHLFPGTFRCSHNLMAKKNAPVKLCLDVLKPFYVIPWLLFLSVVFQVSDFLYPLNYLCKNRECFPSLSSLGSGLFARRKICAT